MNKSPIPFSTRLVGRTRAFAAIVFGLVSAATVAAFPPAPHYTIFGDVRDEFGYLIPAGTASVVLSLNDREVARYPITGAPGTDYNYQIRMKIDMSRVGTSAYSSLAFSTGTTYSLAVDIGGVLYYPIEINTPPTIGASADRRRLDLTLGADTDRDGIPDAWEELQLYLAGLPTGDLSQVSRDGDLDGDGRTNLQEYIAGTYATDATETFYLTIKEATETQATVEFFAITSKTYTLEKSIDLQTWSTASFAAGSNATAATTYTATGVGVVNGTIARTVGETKTFYRLKVR